VQTRGISVILFEKCEIFGGALCITVHCLLKKFRENSPIHFRETWQKFMKYDSGLSAATRHKFLKEEYHFPPLQSADLTPYSNSWRKRAMSHPGQ
jgi:hypothetical protein